MIPGDGQLWLVTNSTGETCLNSGTCPQVQYLYDALGQIIGIDSTTPNAPNR